MYERLLDAFPDALLEDPHDLPDITPLVAPHAARVSYDAPIATRGRPRRDADPGAHVQHQADAHRIAADAARALRGLRRSAAIAIYGGGMGELGVARGQIQLLASLFSPDGPNDIAPPGFNAARPGGRDAGQPARSQPRAHRLPARLRGQSPESHTPLGYASGMATRGYTATKEQLHSRLNRVEGQIRGIRGMVEEDRYCIDILTQISAAQAALDKVALGLLDQHAHHCMAGDGERGEQTDELMAAVGRLMRRG